MVLSIRSASVVRCPGALRLRHGKMDPSQPESPINDGTSSAILADRLAGTLLGTALGDALGLPCEGMSARAIARRFGRVEAFRLLGSTGFVSDDTEQAVLIVQSLARQPADAEQCSAEFRRALLAWCCRLPWGAGRATLRACGRIAVGLRPSGVASAGNGAAMRAAVIGVFFRDQPGERERFGRALAEVTHRDPRAVEGALYVAELAAMCAGWTGTPMLFDLAVDAARVVRDPSMRETILRAVAHAREASPTTRAVADSGSSGFVAHTVPFALFCFLQYGNEPLTALSEAISVGGDTDSIAAIVGAWIGALYGEAKLPTPLIASIHDGPFGPTHLRALAHCLTQVRAGAPVTVPGYSAQAALARNLALWPVILAHGFRRLLPL
jgi:ADP-ribosyl-[dinitrogen reductase] hydrolase